MAGQNNGRANPSRNISSFSCSTNTTSSSLMVPSIEICTFIPSLQWVYGYLL